MKIMKMLFLRCRLYFIYMAVLFSGLSLTGCELSLAQDILPPPNYQRVSLERPSADAVFVSPSQSPNLASGAAIFAKSCAPCHGETGMGGGSQADKLPKQPPNIGSAEVAGQASPVDWFAMVTLGKIDALMPPFEEELSVQERWDVLAYVYTLAGAADVFASVLPDELEIVDQPLAPPATEEVVLEPQPTQPGTSEPTPAPDSGATPGVEAEPEATAEPVELGSVTGLVTHGGGMELPAGLEVKLLAFDGFEPAYELSMPVAPDGSYEFSDVGLAPERVFLTTVLYQGMSYGSHFNFMPEEQKVLDLPITIYETTSDLSALVTTWLAIRIEFSEPDVARLHFFYQVANPSDVTVLPTAPEEALLLYELPLDALNFSFEQEIFGDYFVVTDGGFGDTRSILAGSDDYTMTFAYDVPYVDAYSIDLPLQIPVESLFVFLPDQGPELAGTGYSESGETMVGEQLYRVSTQTDLPAGDFTIEIRGRHPQAPFSLFGLSLDLPFLVGFALFLLSLVIAAIWYFRLRPAAALAGGRTPEAVLDAIISLDQAFEDGTIEESQYQLRRAQLKERLAVLLEE